eukprot:GHVS01085500.1.p1 GENE.GHVS01085500.1~~GHVS01085500.1.p1  ORF type:complete len:596 (+),score=110.35 GHVS01085500.1:179-1789(+)
MFVVDAANSFPRGGGKGGGGGTSRDFYKILNVKRNASDKEIKRAYRELAKEHHPDKTDEDDDMFMNLRDAKEVLTDPEKRQLYDMGGEEALKEGGAQQGGQGFGDIFDLFNRAGGGGGSGGTFSFSFGGGGGGPRPRRGPPPPTSLYRDSDVVEIKQESYKQIVLQREWALVVEFYKSACDHCVSFKDDYVELHKQFNNIIPVHSVNCDSQSELCDKFDVKSVPHVCLVLPPPDNTADTNRGDDVQFLEYKGQMSSKSVGRWIRQTTPNFVETLSSVKDFNKWITKRNTKQGQVPKVILFTDKRLVPLMISALSYQFRQRLHLALVHTSSKPIIQLFTSAAFPSTFPVLLYVRDMDKLTGEFLKVGGASLEKLSLTFSRILSESRTAQGPYGAHLPFHELTMRRMASGECAKEDSQFCFVVFTYTDFDIKANEMFSSLAIKYKQDPMKLVWVNGTTQSDFARAFGLHANCSDVGGCTQLLAYRPKRSRFKVCSGELSRGRVDAFIDNILSGSQALDIKLNKLPTLSDMTTTQREEL